jgi:hypothetical protein
MLVGQLFANLQFMCRHARLQKEHARMLHHMKMTEAKERSIALLEKEHKDTHARLVQSEALLQSCQSALKLARAERDDYCRLPLELLDLLVLINAAIFCIPAR